MFYGKNEEFGTGNKKMNRQERFEQMTKQQQLIEEKKKQIQARLEAEKKSKAAAANSRERQPTSTNAVGPSSSTAPSSSYTSSSANKQRYSSYSDEEDRADDEDDRRRVTSSTSNSIVNAKVNNFANDGSFMEQFKKMQDAMQLKKKTEEAKAVAAKLIKIKEENLDSNDYGTLHSSNSSYEKPKMKIFMDYGNYGNQQNMQRNVNPSTPSPPSSSSAGNQSQRLATNMNIPPPNFYHQTPPPPPPPPPAVSTPPPNNSNIQSANPPGFPSNAVKLLASLVAKEGDDVEEMTRMSSKDDPLMWFLYRPDSREYHCYRDLVMKLRKELGQSMTYQNVPPPPPPPPLLPQVQKIKQEVLDINTVIMSQNSPPLRPSFNMTNNSNNPISPESEREKRQFDSEGEGDSDSSEKKKNKRSRWGPQSSVAPPIQTVPPVSSLTPEAGPSGIGIAHLGNQIPSVTFFPGLDLKVHEPMVSQVIRTNPQLLAYAKQSYGTINLDEDQWKQCEEAFKMNLIFQDISKKKLRDEKLAQQGKFKHEYDSDEEVDQDLGTWEHKQRLMEMEKTRNWADDLTIKAKGKHHIGDFLPPDELSKFMDKYKAVKEGKEVDKSEYQDNKIAEDNVGFKMLQKMGWSGEGGLGLSNQGIIAPISQGSAATNNQGLGIEKPNEISEEDDEYAAYRKRMMLAYRFRPNPMNNPRRTYY